MVLVHDKHDKTQVTILYNARIYTANDAYPFTATLALKNKRFERVGGSLEEWIMYYPKAKVIDMKNNTIVPGMTDSHAHLMLQGKSLLMADLKGIQIPKIRLKLKDYLKDHEYITPESRIFLIGFGWDQNLFDNPNAFPSKYDLDSDPLLASIPICLIRIDYHAMWLNSKAIEYIYQDSFQQNPLILKSNGELTGIFLDDAMTLVGKVLQDISNL